MHSITGKKIWIAGHNGMVGSALVRRLGRESCEILTAPRSVLDLTDSTEVNEWVSNHRPDVVVIAAAKVGGYPCQQLSTG